MKGVVSPSKRETHMFRKIVTELAYSPALAGKLGEYIRHVRREKIKREVGLILLVLVLIVQLFATSFPPESANANNRTAFVETGIQSIENYLTTYYDQDIEGTKDFLTSFGITRPMLLSTNLTTVKPSPNLLLWTTRSHGDGSDNVYTFFNTTSLKQQTNYYRPLLAGGITSADNSEEPLIAYTGTSPAIGWFAILKDSGNLITRPIHQIGCPLSTQPITSSAQTMNLECLSTLKPSLSVYNISTDSPMSSHTAHPSDRLMYTLTAKNTGDTTLDVPLTIELGDLLEYTQVLDKGGGEFDVDTKTLTWGSTTLRPGEELTRSFIVRLLPVIPSTAQGIYNSASYDCVVSASFGTTLHTPIACPFPKVIEQTMHDLPHFASSLGLAFVATTICIAAYLYIRSRQFLAELHHIQHNHSGSL